MRYLVDIYGEMHTDKDRNRINKLILSRHAKRRYRFLLLEELGIHVYRNEVEKKMAISQKMYSIGPRGLELAIELQIPAIGIDLWGKRNYSKNRYDENGNYIDAVHSFLVREKRMVNVISHYKKKGDVAVIVGDSHLRTVKTPELGDGSLIQRRFGSDRDVNIYRAPEGEIK
jgi:hypothetical protein